MQRIAELAEYYSIIKEAKAQFGSLTTNCCLFPNAIERYIALGRLYYEDVEAGLVVYSDEENFYQAYFHVNCDMAFRIKKKDKPVLIQNVYMEGKKKESFEKIDKTLQQSGFVLEDRLRHGFFVGEDKIPQIRRSMRGIERVFAKEGLTYAPLRREQIPEMLAFQKTISEIPYYQFPYFTDDEYMEEADAERLCCVTDREGRIIAARHLIVNGKKAYGWVGVEEKYKGTYGVAIVFLFHALQYIEEHGVKMCSWVDEKNIPSIQYHDHLGTEWTGHIEDEWILEREM